MFKKWKPFWSYDIDQTEKWLGEMAQKGYRLCGLNPMMRMFTFENGRMEKSNYHISYDKHQQNIPRGLLDAGWDNCVVEGNWSILENNAQQINLFPSRDELVKRNRLHSLILKVISIYYGLQLILPIMLLSIILTSGGDVEVESSPYWGFMILYFLQVIAVLILTVTMTRKLRKFERKYYDMEVDLETSVGQTFAKWKPNWMIRPDLTGQWLEEMAMQGNHLVKVQATRFVFEKGEPKQVAYALDFQWQSSLSYAEIHKSTGWKFIYQTSQVFLKTAIWAKEYEIDEDKPQLTYDLEEKKAQKKKIILAQSGSILVMFLFIGFVLWNVTKSVQYIEWSFYHYFLLTVLGISILMYLYNFIHVIRYALKHE